MTQGEGGAARRGPWPRPPEQLTHSPWVRDESGELNDSNVECAFVQEDMRILTYSSSQFTIGGMVTP